MAARCTSADNRVCAGSLAGKTSSPQAAERCSVNARPRCRRLWAGAAEWNHCSRGSRQWRGPLPPHIVVTPSWNVRRHQRLEQAAVGRDPKVEQFVGDDEILEVRLLLDQVIGERDDAGGRTGTPFPGHPLNTDDPRLDLQALRPIAHSA